MAYEPKLPEGISLPDGFRVDVNDGRYKALHDLATRERWTQKAFSDVLGIEARRVTADHERARAAQPPAATAPAASALPSNWSTMSSSERLAWSLANPKPRG